MSQHSEPEKKPWGKAERSPDTGTGNWHPFSVTRSVSGLKRGWVGLAMVGAGEPAPAWVRLPSWVRDDDLVPVAKVSIYPVQAKAGYGMLRG